MAFVVEDGTGLEDANALIDVAFADSYFSDRGITAWTGDTATVKQPAIVRATDYVNNRFTYLDVKFNEDQSCEFPRGEEALMPVKMKQAVAEYALRALTTVLAPDPTTDATGGKVIEKTEIVGPLEETTKYSESTSLALLKPYPAADMLLRGLIDTARRVIR